MSNILIIEDEPIIAVDLVTTVELLGHTVIGVARTQQEAFELARHTEPDLVISDVVLADRSDGIEAVRELLERHKVPVIMMTGVPERVQLAPMPPNTHLLIKPCPSAEIAKVLLEVLGPTE